MNQIKIGQFIASCRKEQGLTQAALAEKLGITDRAVSKWERGRGLPDPSIMLDLCSALDINVNELLNGERIAMDKYDKKSEQLMLEMAEKEREYGKKLQAAMWVIMITSIVFLLGVCVIVAFLIPEGPLQLVIILITTVIVLAACLFSLYLEVDVGYYKCKVCGHKFVPTYKEVVFSTHTLFTRHLRCPECQNKTWCKKIWRK